MTDELFTATECKILLAQIERRAKYRQEFLRLRTDPCLHSQEAGYVFDPALQRFISMKVTQYETFKASPRTFPVLFLHLAPMVLYGALIWKQRTDREHDIRCGKIKYRDRLFKLA